jgi:asparagine N-glycosylation enzyme membrane subunit Stt3
MKKSPAYFKTAPLSILLLALPLAILAKVLEWGELWVFILSWGWPSSCCLLYR